MPGVRRTRSLARSKKTRELVTTGSPKHSGIPCTMVLTVSFVLFPVIGLFVTVIGGLVCRFNASVEAASARAIPSFANFGKQRALEKFGIPVPLSI